MSAPADEQPFESWADICEDDKAIVACGERWKSVARSIGCELHGFNDGNSASFTTPDGNVIQVGRKFRQALTRPSPVVDGLSAEWERGRTQDGRCFIQGPFLPHDVRLYVNGDFAGQAQEDAYADRIATALSRPAPETTASDDVVASMAHAMMLAARELDEWPFKDTVDIRLVLPALAKAALANLPKPTEQATSPAPRPNPPVRPGARLPNGDAA